MREARQTKIFNLSRAPKCVWKKKEVFALKTFKLRIHEGEICDIYRSFMTVEISTLAERKSNPKKQNYFNSSVWGLEGK